MIIPHKEQLSPSELNEIQSIVKEFNCSIQPIPGATRVILCH